MDEVEGGGAGSVAVEFGRRSSGEACSAIYRAAVVVGDRAAAGAVAVASAEEVSEAAVVAVLAAVLVVETVLVEVARVAVGSRPAQTIWQSQLL